MPGVAAQKRTQSERNMRKAEACLSQSKQALLRGESDPGTRMWSSGTGGRPGSNIWAGLGAQCVCSEVHRAGAGLELRLAGLWRHQDAPFSPCESGIASGSAARHQ